MLNKNLREQESAVDFECAPVGIEPTTFLSSAKQSSIDLQSDVIECIYACSVSFLQKHRYMCCCNRENCAMTSVNHATNCFLPAVLLYFSHKSYQISRMSAHGKRVMEYFPDSCHLQLLNLELESRLFY